MATTESQGVASQALEQVQERTQDARAEMQEKARAQLDGRSSQLGEQVGSVAQALHKAGDQLDGEGNATGAKAARAAAGHAERFGRYLRDSDSDRLVDDVERFARRRPWAVAGIGAALGLAASRFLKASSERRYDSTRRFESDSSMPLGRGAHEEHGYPVPPPEAYEPAYEPVDPLAPTVRTSRRDDPEVV
jgi:ElaB/YqjD/DUF883 family membrane-anchored ribosome-binding protein